MIGVSVEENGDVVYKCLEKECKVQTSIPRTTAQSMFWEVYHGHAVLSMLGHVEADHVKSDPNE